MFVTATSNQVQKFLYQINVLSKSEIQQHFSLPFKAADKDPARVTTNQNICRPNAEEKKKTTKLLPLPFY